MVMQRLFTFGCSFTNWCWPTWADIVSQDYDYYENWGLGGAGNKLIHASLVECIQRNNITADDTVIIMWSSQAREDRFLNGEWFRQGSVYNSEYPEEFVENFTDLTGYLIDTVTYIQSTHHILNQIGCKQHFFSMLPIDISDNIETKWDMLRRKISPTVFDKVLKLYAPVLKQVKPSVWETVFNGDWHSRDYYRIPIEKTSRLKREEFAEQYNAMAGSSWPTFDDFIDEKDDNVDAKVMEEIDKQFDFVKWRHRLKYSRLDHHPTPMEHLEYLDCIQFPTSDKARSFAAHWEDQLLANTANWKSITPERF